MDLPLVSIVVPNFNHGNYLKNMISSVIDQTFTNWEMIIVDNNSTDNSSFIINSFNDKRIQLVNINNKGIVAKSRNLGIKISKGEWIAFLDSDDFWFSEKLEKCLRNYKNVDLIYHEMKLFEVEKNHIINKRKISRTLTPPVLKDLLVDGNTILNSSVLVRKSLLNKVEGLNEDPEMVTCEDYNLWLKISKESDRFLHIPERLGYYAIHNQGLSQRDTSKQLRKAVSGFLTDLSDKEKNYVESFIRFSRLRILIRTKRLAPFYKDLIFCIKYGKFHIKIKSLISFFSLILFFFKFKILGFFCGN